MPLNRSALEQLDREALLTLVLTQQAHIAALETQVATLTARVNELSGEPPAPPPPPCAPFPKPSCPAPPAKGPRNGARTTSPASGTPRRGSSSTSSRPARAAARR